MEKGQEVRAESTKDIQDERLTLEKAKKLFFLSFRFSQGNPILQKEIFNYLHYLHPQWRMQNNLRDQLRKAVEEPIAKHLEGSHKATFHISGISRSDQAMPIDGALSSLQNSLNSKTRRQVDILDITQLMTYRDYKFLIKNKGKGRERMRLQGDTGYSPLLDPFVSHICYYGLEANSTGAEEYDKMFRDVGRVVLEVFTRRGIFRLLNIKDNLLQPTFGDFRNQAIAVVEKYAETHPQSVPKLKSLGFLSTNAV